jgi:hypothetical protein
MSFNRLHFAIKVTFPELSDGSPLLIKKFETDVHNAAHRIRDLNEKVLFQSLHLKGSNGPIHAQVNFISTTWFHPVDIFNYPQSVKAEQGTIKTSNGDIIGVYNTSSLLVLATTNGRVQADIGLSSINESKPKLVVATTNGYAF